MTEINPSEFYPPQFEVTAPGTINTPIPPGDPPSGWRALREAGKADSDRAGNLRSKLSIGALTGLVVFEVGPGGNETAIPVVMSTVSHFSESIFPGSLLAGASAAAFVGAEQLIGGRLLISGLKVAPRLTDRVYRTLSKTVDKDNGKKSAPRFKPFEELPRSKRVSYSLAGGTLFNVLRESVAVGERDEQKLKRINTKSARITAGIVAPGVALLDAGLKSTDNSIVEYVRNPLVVTGIISGVIGGSALINKIKAKKAAKK